MRARKVLTLALAAALLLPAAALISADAPTVDFSLQKGVVAGGGQHSAGEGYELDATAGQPAAGRTAEDTVELVLHAGFWSACLADAPVPPAVSMTRAGSDVVLDWTAPPEDVAYYLWVSEDPTLAPDDAAGVTPVLTDLTTYTDPAAAGSLINHFYLLRGLNDCGAASGDANRTGEFTFGLTPGT